LTTFATTVSSFFLPKSLMGSLVWRSVGKYFDWVLSTLPLPFRILFAVRWVDAAWLPRRVPWIHRRRAGANSRRTAWTPPCQRPRHPPMWWEVVWG